MGALVECVPNFSEGRDPAVIAAIARAIETVAGAAVLHVDRGVATHRTVVTFVAPPDAVVEAAFRAIERACALIDMRVHAGAHPRMGATDVCPLVPLEGIDLAGCAELARRLGERVGDELQVPVYYYGAAARSSGRRELARIRRGEYEGLPARLAEAGGAPDAGPRTFNARSGASAIGAREILVAYNVNLASRDVAAARQIALDVRERGRVARDVAGRKVRDAAGRLVRVPGLPAVRAGGWSIPEYGCAQVTMNLLDYSATPLHVVYERVAQLAAARGQRVTGSELIGLVPRAALLSAGEHFRPESAGDPDALVAAAVTGLGLDQLGPFDPYQRVLEARIAARVGDVARGVKG